MLAREIGISLPTLRQAERGQGAHSTFVNLAAALDMEIGGRSLPPGETLGLRLAALRKRRGLGRRIVAQMAGISPTTLAAIERNSGTHLASMVRVGEALGAQLRLVPKGTSTQFWTTTAASSAHEGWTTPPQILEPLYKVVGGTFDLDPCSPVRSGPKAPVRARVRYIAEDDSLKLPWIGKVFMNPPYGRVLPKWTAKARVEVQAGRSSVVFGLIPARTDTRWWHTDVAGHADVWLLRGRLAFGDGVQPAPFPSAIVVWAASDDHRMLMSLAFPDAWHIPGASRSGDDHSDALLAAGD